MYFGQVASCSIVALVTSLNVHASFANPGSICGNCGRGLIASTSLPSNAYDKRAYAQSGARNLDLLNPEITLPAVVSSQPHTILSRPPNAVSLNGPDNQVTATTALHYQSLIHQQGAEKAEVSARNLNDSTKIQEFSVRPATPTYRPGQFEPKTAGYRLQGVIAEHDLRLLGQHTLTLTGGWISGEKAQAAGAQSFDTDGGSAWSLAANTAFLSDRLLMHLEYAGSLDSESERNGTGSAYTGSLRYAGASGDTRWSTGTEYAQVGQNFHSVANPGVAADRRQIKLYGDLQVKDLAFNLTLRQHHDNLAGQNPATNFQRNTSLATTWTPASLGSLLLGGLLGKPHLSLLADFGVNQQHGEGMLTLTGQERSRALSFQSRFRYGPAQWGFNALTSQQQNLSDSNLDSHTTQLELFGDVFLLGEIPLSPKVSWKRELNGSLGTTSEAWRAELRSTGFGTNHRLRGELGVDFKHQTSLQDNRALQAGLRIGGNLVWIVQERSRNHGGLTFSVSSAWLNGNSSLVARDGESDFRVMLSLAAGLPVAL